MDRYFGKFGGRFVSETLIPALDELEAAYEKFSNDEEFKTELDNYLKNYAGRKTPLYFARRLSEHVDGAKIYLKREDLLHTGAHKINNVIGQALLAKKMGKKRIIAETGAGQHGVASATAAALLGLECVVYMGKIDAERQALNVYRMELLGAKVEVIDEGTQTLKDAVNAALRDYSENFATTHYLIGSALGPHPYPTIVRNFQSIIGKETKEQIMEHEGKLPEYLIACVGGGSNAIGLFHEFRNDLGVKMIGVEAGGNGKDQHAARLTGKAGIGVLHGMKSYLLSDKDGQIKDTYSVSAGLDYASVGPEHSLMKELGRANYVEITDQEALDAFHKLAELEGILAALESAHAVAYAIKLAKEIGRDNVIVVNLSGRGDKDVEYLRRLEAKI